jgi:2-keto-4-pentenoate hydratase/2-oxohepta-3-ene-1,7-dioic acid hydratase in catechol pathway
MRIARVKTEGGTTRHAIIDGEKARLVDGDILGSWRATGQTVWLREVTLLAPLVPANVLCFGRNYKAHALEGGAAPPSSPLLFLKATSCVNDPEGSIVLPAAAPSRVDFEAELAVVIGKATRNVSPADALGRVLGYACANDVSARDVQEADGQWSRAKSFDGFGPLGPWIETELDPRDLRIQGRLNGTVMQDARTSELIFDVPYLVSWLSRCMTLLPGTVLLTGTPAGCGFARTPPVWLKPGDRFEVDIEGIGTLRNVVRPVEEEPI